MAEDNKSSSPKVVRDLMSVGVLTCSPNTVAVELTRVLLEKDWTYKSYYNPDVTGLMVASLAMVPEVKNCQLCS